MDRDQCKAGSSSMAGMVLAVPSFGLLKINKKYARAINETLTW